MSKDNRKNGGGERRKRTRPVLEELLEGDGRRKAHKGSEVGGGDGEGQQLGSGESKFARALGSTDFQTREKGLNALSHWLASRADVPELDLLKLWKGVFYCFWHSDKAPVQDDLAKRLSETLHRLQPTVAYTYFSSFLKTIRREWMGIDRLRLDKFMLLIRYFLRHVLLLLHKSNWDSQLVTQYMQAIRDGCLLPTDTVPAAGVAYHLADIYVDEVDTVTEDSRPASKVLLALLRPFREALTLSPSQPLLHRVRDSVFHTAAERYQNAEGAMASLDGSAMSEELFRIGSEDAAGQKNRVVLYELSKVFNKAAKKARPIDESEANGAPAEEDRGAGSSAGKQKGTASKKAGKKGKFVSSGDMKEGHGGKASGTDVPSAGSDGPQEGGEGMQPAPKKQKKTKAAKTAAGPVEAEQQLSSAQLKKAIKKASSKPLGANEATETPLTGKKAGKKKAASGKSVIGVMDTVAASGGEACRGSQGAGKPSPAAEGTPATPASEGAILRPRQQPQSTAGKKSVRFAMKHNLYFQFGGPLPDPDIRTPPTARPKGPALKKMSSVGRSKTPNMFGKKREVPRTPRSTPRPSALDFF